MKPEHIDQTNIKPIVKIGKDWVLLWCGNTLAEMVKDHGIDVGQYLYSESLINNLFLQIQELKSSRTEYMDICEQLSRHLAESREEIERLKAAK